MELLGAGGVLTSLVPHAKKDTLLGRILTGTIFGPVEAKKASDGSLAAVQQNTAAVQNLTTAIQSAGIGLGSAGLKTPFLTPLFGKDGLGRLLGAASPLGALALQNLFGPRTGIIAGSAIAGGIFGAKGAGFGIAGLGKVGGALAGGAITGGLAFLLSKALLPKSPDPLARAAEIERTLGRSARKSEAQDVTTDNRN